jgi:hypothetical protein
MGWQDALFSSCQATDLLADIDLMSNRANEGTCQAASRQIPESELPATVNLNESKFAGLRGRYGFCTSTLPASQSLATDLCVGGGAASWLGSGLAFAAAALAMNGQSLAPSGALLAAAGTGRSALPPVHLSFNASTGQLSIDTLKGQHAISESITSEGSLNLTIDGQSHSSNPLSAAFDASLAGAAAATVTGIHFQGGGQDTLTLGSQQHAGGFTVQATGATVLMQNVVAAGPLTIRALNITVNGVVQGSSVSLAASGWVTVNAAGRIDASSDRTGSVNSLNAITVAASTFVNTGQLHADGSSGGQITMQAAIFSTPV